MKPIRAVTVVGLVGIVGLTASCQPANTNANASQNPTEMKDEDLRLYLGENGAMHKWQKEVWKGICQLEEHASGIDPQDRVCPTGTPTGTPPPKYPPAQ